MPYSKEIEDALEELFQRREKEGALPPGGRRMGDPRLSIWDIHLSLLRRFPHTRIPTEQTINNRWRKRGQKG